MSLRCLDGDGVVDDGHGGVSGDEIKESCQLTDFCQPSSYPTMFSGTTSRQQLPTSSCRIRSAHSLRKTRETFWKGVLGGMAVEAALDGNCSRERRCSMRLEKAT